VKKTARWAVFQLSGASLPQTSAADAQQLHPVTSTRKTDLFRQVGFSMKFAFGE